MSDAYRTAVNPYTAKAAEARAKLQRERTAATELEAQRVALLAEVNAGLAPFQVYRRQGYTFEYNSVRLTHPDSGEAYYLCDEATMLEDLPRRLGTAHFAKCVEQIETDIKKRADRKALLRRAVEPVGLAIAGTLLTCALWSDFEWGRVAFVLVCTLAFNFWWYARNEAGNTTTRNYALNARRAVLKETRPNIEHVNADAIAFEEFAEVVYCDPPYEGTTGYTAVAAAEDGARLWTWSRLIAWAGKVAGDDAAEVSSLR